MLVLLVLVEEKRGVAVPVVFEEEYIHSNFAGSSLFSGIQSGTSKCLYFPLASDDSGMNEEE